MAAAGQPEARSRASACRTLALSLSAALLVACSPALDWREFSWPEAAFSVLLPGKPMRDRRGVLIGDRALDMTMFSVRSDPFTFAVGFADLLQPADAREQDAIVRDGAAALLGNLGLPESRESAITLDGHPGRELRVVGTVQGRDLAYVARVYATDRRFYQLVFIGPRARAEEVDVELFLRSFKLLR